MRHARADYDMIQDLTGRIGENEPVFLFRAKDVLAPVVLARYAELLKQHGCQQEMINATLLWEAEMRKWARINGCKLPDMPVEKINPILDDPRQEPLIVNTVHCPKPKADFSGWVGHRARMAGGSITIVHGESASTIFAPKPDNIVWDKFSGKNIIPGLEAYDLVELLDGPTRNRKGE